MGDTSNFYEGSEKASEFDQSHWAAFRVGVMVGVALIFVAYLIARWDLNTDMDVREPYQCDYCGAFYMEPKEHRICPKAPASKPVKPKRGKRDGTVSSARAGEPVSSMLGLGQDSA